jgi:hypothetical protein
MATEAEFKELKDTVASLVKKVDSMSELLAKRLIETVEPLPDEIEATQQYQEDKKNRTVEFVPLEKLQRQ